MTGDAISHPAVSEAQHQLSSALAELRSLCDSLDSTTLFVATAAFLGNPDPRLPSELLHLIPAKLQILLFVASESFHKTAHSTITESHLASCIRALDRAYDARRTILCGAYFAKDKEFNPTSFLLSSLAIETSMGVGAAEIEQARSLIRIAQGRWDMWFEDKCGIRPTRLIDMLDAIVKVQCTEARLEVLEKASAVWQRSFTGAVDTEDVSAFLRLDELPVFDSQAVGVVPVGRDEVERFCPVSESEWKGLTSLIGCNANRRSQLQDSLDVLRFPLAAFADNRVFVINLASCLEAAFEQFDAAAKSDANFFSGKYQRRISDYLETNAAACLERLFPKECVFRQILYPNPDRTDGGVAELDLAVLWPPFLLIGEAKAKQLRFSPAGADLARFCTDVKANIEDGFDQACRFLRYLQTVEDARLSERGGGREIHIVKADLRKTFALSVCLRRLVSMGGQLPTLRDMGLFKDGQFPWAVALDDLDLITRFCPTTDVFLHFVERRLALEQEEVRYAGSEPDFFGTYLNSGRLEPEIWKTMERLPNLITLSSYHEQFSKAIHLERQDVPVIAPVPLNVPPIVRDVLDELSFRSNEPQARWIAFCLLSLSDEELAGLQFTIDALKSSPRSTGTTRSTSLKCGVALFCVTVTEDLDLKDLYDITMNRSMSEKYRNKADVCAAFGIQLRDRTKPFAHAFWMEGKWQPDATLEKVVADMKTRRSVLLPPGATMPGRNDRCPCGSGKKFKHCCLNKYQNPTCEM
jgi:hypothetical protein